MMVTKRQFLKISASTVAAVALADKALALTALQPVVEVGNPLGGISRSFVGTGVSRPIPV
jgi:nitrate reductase / nitrite oxidoreductase, alpha subunit